MRPIPLAYLAVVIQLGLAVTAFGAGRYSEVEYSPSKEPAELQLGVT